MAVVPFTGPTKAPDLDIDPAFLQMAGAVLHAEAQAKQPKSENKSNEPADSNNL